MFFPDTTDIKFLPKSVGYSMRQISQL